MNETDATSCDCRREKRCHIPLAGCGWVAMMSFQPFLNTNEQRTHCLRIICPKPKAQRPGQNVVFSFIHQLPVIALKYHVVLRYLANTTLLHPSTAVVNLQQPRSFFSFERQTNGTPTTKNGATIGRRYQHKKPESNPVSQRQLTTSTKKRSSTQRGGAHAKQLCCCPSSATRDRGAAADRFPLRGSCCAARYGPRRRDSAQGQDTRRHHIVHLVSGIAR